jgi:hypothetical protein
MDSQISVRNIFIFEISEIFVRKFFFICEISEIGVRFYGATNSLYDSYSPTMSST